MTNAITIENLRKEYRIHRKEPGFFGSVKSLFHRQHETVEAVKDISLTIEEGELVGFIGPNGAGKTTTLKMMSGLLHPTSGKARVLGHTPWQRKKEFLQQLSLIMGQKAQLWWDLPLYDSLLLQRDIYEMSGADFKESLQELTELLDLEPFLKVQARKMSLGQRMRGELAAAFIYHPRIVFLDEPTIGLDIVVQKNIREFIKTYNKRHNATIILTSHYLDDVRELCKRIVVIDHGTLVFDGETENLIKKHITHKHITLIFTKKVPKEKLQSYGEIVFYNDIEATIRVDSRSVSQTAASLLATLPVHDISIEDPGLEDVVHKLFTKKSK